MFGNGRVRGRRPRRLVSRFADYLRGSGNGGIGRLILASCLLLAITALAAVGLGLFTRPAAPAAAAPAPAAPAREAAAGTAGLHFGAMGGYGCRQSPQVRFGEYGQYTNGISGFVTVRTGGWARQGCDGRFDAMPMSGNANRPDPSNYALWTFRTGAITRGTCQIAVFVPDDASIEHAGGNPAHYQVFDAATAAGPAAGAFTIDQRTSRGQWVSAGSYPVTAGVLTVKLTSAGQDWHGNVVTHAHLAIAQVLLFCSQ